jgi:hypothetical protein
MVPEMFKCVLNVMVLNWNNLLFIVHYKHITLYFPFGFSVVHFKPKFHFPNTDLLSKISAIFFFIYFNKEDLDGRTSKL